MLAADKGKPPPPELQLSWWCSDGRLPEAGGVLDQDYELFYRMQALSNIYSFVVRLRKLAGPQIHSLSKPERRLWKALIDMGMM